MNDEQLRAIIAQAVATVLAEQNDTSTPSAPSSQADQAAPASAKQTMTITENGPAKKGSDPKEVVVAISPNFYRNQTETIIGIPHEVVLSEIAAGIEEEGLNVRFIRVQRTADVAFVAHEAAKTSGSSIGVGVIARGTCVIHQRDLAPLNNLELFPQCPLLDAETFRAIGKNAARYAKGESPDPVPVRNDQMARPRYQAIAALMHNKETQLVDLAAKNLELRVNF